MKLRKNVLKSIQFMDQSLASSLTLVQRNAMDFALSTLQECNLESVDADFSSSVAAVHLPVDLLKEYEAVRQESLLGQIFVRANELHALVDRVIILAPHSVTLAIQTIQSACCQPYWNELSRAARGSKPRLNLISDRSDNDSIQGLLDMLGSHQDMHITEVLDRWAVILVCPEGGGALADLYLRHFLPALTRQLDLTPGIATRCSLVMARSDSEIAKALQRSGRSVDFRLERFCGTSGIFSEAALLPAALLGVNVMEFVGGAAAHSMEGLKANKPFSDKMMRMAAMNYASCSGESDCYVRNTTRKLECFADSLRSLDDWYLDQIEGRQADIEQRLRSACSENLEFQAFSDSSPSTVHPYNKPLVHQIVTSDWRYDQLSVATSFDGFSGELGNERISPQVLELDVHLDLDVSNERGVLKLSVETLEGSLSDAKLLTIPRLTNKKADRIYSSRAECFDPSTRIELPIVDELHTGYLVQWFLVASTLEQGLFERQLTSECG